ncbi:hypothetical protein N7468_001275 [Penicillium chermesinum]|uniref:Uncharacterized protein n=1 Tax=Penicillium chermesinum TaxID=63820 RepID=A0A9W9TWW6_9EURO|nr:uncharacterized protein N7468_001275 [Penicillium chermesinum]KAJ5246292.1 hypothetical protein N7468_001275 [Penicillium chermesinum]
MASSKLPSYWEQTELESSSKGSHECLPAYSERTPTTEQNSSDQSSCGKWTSVKGAIWSYIKGTSKYMAYHWAKASLLTLRAGDVYKYHPSVVQERYADEFMRRDQARK